MFKTLIAIPGLMAMLTLMLWLTGVNTSEFGPVELMQNAVLCLALVTWIILTKTIYQHKGLANFHYIFAYFFSVLMYVVLGRELSWLKVLTGNAELAKTIELISIILVLELLLSMLYIWVMKVDTRRTVLIIFLKSNTFKFAVAGLIFVLVGDIFEKKTSTC